MKTSHSIYIGTVLCSVALGCGTIMHGSTQELGIGSNPAGATVTVNGQELGRTPVIADLKRKDTHLVLIELDGYEAFETTLTRKTSGWVWGNILFGGLIGLAVDAITGGLYDLTPEQISAELRSAGTAMNSSSDEQFVLFIVMEPQDDWEKIGQLSILK